MKQKYFLKTFLILCLTLSSFQILGQAISDDFEDGDITGWTEGTASHWTNSTSSPITGTRSLKHNLSGVSDNSYIYHSISSLDLTTQDVTWSFNLANGSWDPSSANKFWVYLTANDTNLNGGTVDGYAVGVNLTGSSDILTLWKVTNGAADGAIVTSTLDWNSSTTAGIRVTRSSAGAWELLIDTNGGFDNLVSAGTASNTDYTHDDNFGLSFTFSSSRAGLLRMDDVTVEGSSAAPTVGFDSATSSENETDATFTSANIPITVSNYDGNQIDIDINVTGGTAEVGDYTFTSPTALSFLADGTQNITVDINEDIDDFDDETIIFTITETSSVTGLVISQSTHTLTIVDDETAPTVGFDNATSTETETDATFTSANIPITVSSYSGTQIDVSISVTGGTAEAGDYTFTSPTALSFTTNETQNITVDINEDTDDFDDETIIFTLTETSSVSGLVISQSTHTLTITEDEMAPIPTAGSLIITEVLDSDVGFNNDYLEIFNNSSATVSLSTTKLIRMSSGGTFEFAYDFGTDESTASVDVNIPAYGFMIVARGSTRSDFNTANSITLDAGVSFNGGNGDLFFGTGRRWSLKTGGTANTDDGTLIDDTLIGVGTSKDYRNIFTDTFISGLTTEGTPGELEYLLYTGNAWVNSTAMDATTGTKDAYIYDDLTLSANAEANDVGIIDTKGINIDAGNSLTINGDLTFNGTTSYLQANGTVPSAGVINSASVILKGSLTEGGSNQFFYFTETFHDNTSGWSLVSSPTVGEKIDGNDGGSDGNFAVFNGLQKNATDYGIAIYDNSQSDTNLRWDYFSQAAIDVAKASASITMDNGIGYSIFPDSGASVGQNKGNIGFKGAIATIDVNVTLTDNAGTSGNAFNLVGNPYPSFSPFNVNANASNLITSNTSNLDEHTFWLWDKATTEYIEVNQTTTVGTGMNQRPSLYLAPAQGFFVKSKIGGGTFTFPEAIQSHQASGTFNRSVNTRPEINVSITDNSSTKNALIYYYDGKTTGFDNGYDSSIFGGVANTFDVYTQLVSDNEGKNLGIQTLPNSGFETMVIPVGINAPENTSLTLSAKSLNLPSGIKVVLEDRLNNTFTDLTTDNYSFTTTSTLKGIGRFYIHTTSSVLNIDTNTLNSVTIFNSGNNVKILGLSNDKTSFQLFNLLGKQLLNTSFKASNGLKEISLPNLSSGVYVIQLENGNGKLNKKIILN